MASDRESHIERICHGALGLNAAAREAFVTEACAGDAALQREVESLLAQESAAAGFMSTPADRWKRISQLYEAVRAYSPGERTARLAEACAGDKGLQHEVQALLDQPTSPLLAGSPLAIVARVMDPSRPAMTGSRLGVYQLQELIGAGGMGEVYRARDTRLGRYVAIKILHGAFTHDADRLARFEREARALAGLNHPNIAAIYGVEDTRAETGSQISALVMELVEGETLADRLEKGPIGIDETLRIARQITEALEAAHDKGIVHRDLKPANIKTTSDDVVKVLDFGLAKAARDDGSGLHLTQSPTFTIGGTRDGVILGTAAYMSPEQARGKPVDKRTDIWAFGCVLYEMLTGRVPFAGDTVSDTIAAILEREPGWAALPASTPLPVKRLLQRCLDKDPRRRLHDIADARLDLDEAPGDLPMDARHASRARRLARFTWGMAVLLLVTVIAATGMLWRVGNRPSSPPPQVRFEIEALPTSYPETLAISPDGGKIVFAGTSDDGRSLLWLHSLDAASAKPLAGSDGGRTAFWSPDSRSIAFFADGSLKRMDVETATVVPLANAPEAHPGTWSGDGTILFAPFTGSPILRVSDRGGDAQPVKSAAGVSRLYPRFLPDGRHFLYVTGPMPRGIYVAQLNGAERRRLVTGTSVEYAPSGHLLFTRDRTVFAQPFDPESFELKESPVQVAERVIAMSVATNGTLVFRSGAAAGRELAWFNRSGKEVSRPSGPGNNPSLSPDGDRVALSRVSPGPATRPDIWILDLERNVFSSVTAPPGVHNSPLWSPDGASITFASERNRKSFALYSRSVAGGGDERLLLETAEAVIPNDWSPDGRFLIYRSSNPKTDFDLWALSLEDKQTFPLVQTMAAEREAQFSPDGRWFAYQSNESGRFEIYIRPFPEPERWRYGPVSNGGVQVRWRRDGRELFYLGLDSTLMAVRMEASLTGDPIAGSPVPLFRANVGVGESFGVQDYAVSSDGTRFLIDKLQEVTRPITVILNWKPKP